jgi:hypothetical protein
MRIIALFSAAFLAQIPNMPELAEGGHVVKWAIQSGSFAALFVVFAFVALQYLAKQASEARLSEAASHAELLKQEAARSEAYAKMLADLTAAQAKSAMLMERVTSTMEQVTRSLTGLESSCRAHMRENT